MNNAHTLKILFRESFSFDDFEITHAKYADEVNLVRSMYSTLVEYDNNGQIIAGLAKEYSVKSDEIRFTLRDNAKDSSGAAITTAEVKNSLIKVIENNHSTHFDLSQHICTVDNCEYFTTISDDEFSIKYRGDAKFLLQALTNPEAAIIPKSGRNKETGKINYKVTSGAYYASNTTSGKIVLEANKHDHHYSDKIAQKIIFTYKGYNIASLADAYKLGEFDFLPPQYLAQHTKILKEFENESSVNIHKTLNLCLTYLSFSDHATANLPLQRRIKIAKKIRNKFLSAAKNDPSIKPAIGFFSVFGESTLTKEEEKSIEEQYDITTETDETGYGLTIGAATSEAQKAYTEYYRDILPDAKVTLYKENSTPDIELSIIDSGFSDNISLITYSLNSAIFNKIDKKDSWQANYLKQSPHKRIEMLKQQHVTELNRFHTIPISTMPYVSIIRNKWKTNFSPIFLSSPYWRIENEK